MDPVVLLEPRSEDSPSGENLEYDPLFTEMEDAAKPPEDSQFDGEEDGGKEPDYREVAEKALAIMEQSHDLRAAIYLADAQLHTAGLKGFADATQVIRGYLEDFWATCYPDLDEDDDNDPTMRINAIQGLCGQPNGIAGPSAVYRSLRRVALTGSKNFGPFSIRDIEIAEGQTAVPEGMENPPDSASVSAAFRDTDPDKLQETLDHAKRATDNVKAISAVFDEQTPGRAPDLDPTIKLLGQIAKLLGRYAGSGSAAPAAEAEEEEAAPAPRSSGPAPSGGAVGAIRSPADVSNAIDRIIEYYNRYEPSSPLPLLLMRAKRLVSADFLTIVKDMAPGGIDNVNLIGGLEED
ncbi:MAG: type VI secretion system protein TssA [Rhodocyclaceae bacterium]|nr:type VI secretion system protein TssA [Rhodocyclaceae bacterium]